MTSFLGYSQVDEIDEKCVKKVSVDVRSRTSVGINQDSHKQSIKRKSSLASINCTRDRGVFFQ